MKKIFLPLLALCGMVAGLTLTSCGGGGGSGNMSGKTLVLQTGIGYYIEFNEKIQGTGQSYYARLWNDEQQEANIWVTVTRAPEYNKDGKLISMGADVSTTSSLYEDCEIFLTIVNTAPKQDGQEPPDIASLYSPASMDIQPAQGEEGVLAHLTWTLTGMKPKVDKDGNPIEGEYEETSQVMPIQNVIGFY